MILPEFSMKPQMVSCGELSTEGANSMGKAEHVNAEARYGDDAKSTIWRRCDEIQNCRHFGQRVSRAAFVD